MGQVFKAEHRRMHRIVAVKLLPAAMAKDRSAIARFEREVTAAAKISHPNIVRATTRAGQWRPLPRHGVRGRSELVPALVLEKKPFDPVPEPPTTSPGADGMQHAHAGDGPPRHQARQPALDHTGVIKFLDMGLARPLQRAAGPDVTEMTSKAWSGHRRLPGPRAGRSKMVDIRADIYSLGCSLHYLRQGDLRRRDSLMAQLLAHREQQPIPAARRLARRFQNRSKLSSRKMVAKKIEDRYQSEAEVIADLERCGARPEQPASPQQSFGSSDTDLTDFLKDLSKEPKKHAPPKPKSAGRTAWVKRHKLPLIGAGVLGVLVLASPASSSASRRATAR